MVFTQVIKFNVKPEFKDEFKQTLQINKQGTAQEPGNLAMRIYQDNSDPNTFFAYDRWADKAAAQSHLQQSYTQKLISLIDTVLTEAPQVYNVEDTDPAPVALLEADPQDPRFNIVFIFKIKPGTCDQLLAQFKEHITHTRTEAGCLLFDLYKVEGDEDTLVVYEHWRKESDVWDIHFNQPYAVETGKLMEACVVGDMQQYMNFVTQIA